MEHQQAISTARLLTRIGRKIAVLINESGDDGIVGRPSADAPYFQPNIPPPAPFTIGLGTVRAEAGRQLA